MSLRSGPVGPVLVGLVLVGPVPVGPVPVGPVPVGLVPVGPVPVGPVPVGPEPRIPMAWISEGNMIACLGGADKLWRALKNQLLISQDIWPDIWSILFHASSSSGSSASCVSHSNILG